MGRIFRKVLCVVLGVLICVSLAGCTIGEYAVCDTFRDEDGTLHFMLLGKHGASGGEQEAENTGSIFNGGASHFDNYTGEETDTAYVVKGRVSQENDDNAVVLLIQAEENTTITVNGTLRKISGSDTELIYEAENGERTKIADNSSDFYDVTLDISKGKSRVIFTGKSAVYDFEAEFTLADGVSYGSN